jgi:signal transduction histidine kinase
MSDPSESLPDGVPCTPPVEESALLAQFRLLNRVAQVTAGSPDLSLILSVTLRELDRHLRLHGCAIWLPAEECQSQAVPLGFSGSAVPDRAGAEKNHLKLAEWDPSALAVRLDLVSGEQILLEQTPFAACINDGLAVYADLTRPQERKDALSERLAKSGANATFAVPLRSGDQTVGILQSICIRPTGFTNAQIQLLYLVADLLGPSIARCQLFGRLRTAYEKLRDTQTQLIQAEKLRAVGELASGMAHDFNNSLCGVLGFLELGLAEKELAPGLRVNLESARTCALDAAQTVRRVQEFARRQRNESSVQLLDSNELVRKTLQLTRHKWEGTSTPERPIVVDVLTEATARIYGTETELREVLTNLIFNAVDAMPRGGRLTVRTWNSDREAFLAVSDTGTGMSPGVKQRLFEPFFTTKGEGGNGLGLSVAFSIVGRYGGEITVDSELNKGSTFVIRLPAVPSPRTKKSSSTQTACPPNSQPEAPAASLKRLALAKALRILVIEDEEAIRRFLQMALEQLGHSPEISADPAEALVAFQQQSFDMVLTDYGLPGMNGEEVARAIHRTSPKTPVVLLTGWANQLKADSKPIDGVARILGKPVTLQALAETINSVR